MAAKIISGKEISREIREELKKRFGNLKRNTGLLRVWLPFWWETIPLRSPM